jgi:hypothetical protein
MEPYLKPPPGRPRIVEGGVEVKIEIDGRVRSVIVTRRTFDFHVAPPPSHVTQPSIERGWLGLVQHNMDRVRAGAERKLASTDSSADTILLEPGEVDLPKWT